VKAWKYLILIGGIVGIAGFFLPFITFQTTDGTITGSISAYRIVSGIDDVTQVLEGAKPVTMANNEVKHFVTMFNDELATYRGALTAFFAPAAALALFGAICGWRRKIGRIGGLLALLLGLANAGVWLLFFQVSSQATDKTAAMGIGLHALLVAGVLGVVAGAGAMLLPDRGEFYD
jgi:hypothetical protein